MALDALIQVFAGRSYFHNIVSRGAAANSVVCIAAFGNFSFRVIFHAFSNMDIFSNVNYEMENTNQRAGTCILKVYTTETKSPAPRAAPCCIARATRD